MANGSITLARFGLGSLKTPNRRGRLLSIRGGPLRVAVADSGAPRGARRGYTARALQSLFPEQRRYVQTDASVTRRFYCAGGPSRLS